MRRRRRASSTWARRRAIGTTWSSSRPTSAFCKPADPARGNRRLFFDYSNRGNKRAVQYFCDAPACNDPAAPEHAGNGYLFRRGYTVVWGAWQGDLLPGDGRMTMDLPVATDGAAPLTGPVRTEFIVAQEGQTSLPLSGWVSTRSHPAVSRETSKARLTRRRYPDDQRIEIAPEAWQFARLETGVGLDFQGAEHAIVESDSHIYLPAGSSRAGSTSSSTRAAIRWFWGSATWRCATS